METTEKQHAAMVAAGMTDKELQDVLRDRGDFARHYVNAVADEVENRAQARFQTHLERKRRG